MKSLLVSLSLSSLLAGFAVAAQNNISIEYLPAKDKEERSAQQLIANSGVNAILTGLSDAHFAFNQTLTIQYGAEDGPMYDPEAHTVYMPYSFVAESLQYFRDNDYQEKFGKEPQLGAIDTILHTLLHEAGHAFVADQNIPVLGKEEDAVDNFATLMMINYVEGGDDAAISAADMFAFESDNRPDYYDFGEYIDEHSFDLQRYFSTLCLVYGSDPEKHQNLLEEVEKDYLSERKDFCIDNFDQLDQSWHQYLSSKKPENAK
ncbi:DUF4344 domain-containing metallopeptidase [Photobacterium sp. SDRW27]|uniref:DUF4344 domain-containing metallopeptidase n=1 Tax=Photobacterium obscurum TaxID=2829490 RepID=UPI002244B245|nr:DUF4344 domain-containing metallopeptidase [Photobacterium obscurum]MCW8329420.1 DUF4344 domain-containing metallopeptidase [Photobacterium obscurum]